jgi:hypothetical protein
MLLVPFVAVLLGACSGEEEPARAPSSTRDEPFEIVQQDGGEYVVGHGIAMRLPGEWTDYESEQDSADGTSYEWAVGLPAETRPLPAGVQFSMGKAGKGVPFEKLPEVTRELAEQAPGYELVDEGEAGVPGAEAAAFLRIKKDLELDGKTVKVEQLQLMLQMPGGQSSVLRFIAEDGKWEEQMQSAYDSLVVAEKVTDG